MFLVHLSNTVQRKKKRKSFVYLLQQLLNKDQHNQQPSSNNLMKYYCVSDSGEDECASTFIVTYFMQESIKNQIDRVLLPLPLLLSPVPVLVINKNLKNHVLFKALIHLKVNQFENQPFKK